MRVLIAIMMITFLMTGAEAAQKKGKKKKRRSRSKSSQSIQVVDFNEVIVKGSLKKPTITYIQDTDDYSFNKLVKPRENFIPELKDSVDNI